MDCGEYRNCRPDAIVTRAGADGPESTLAALNGTFAPALPRLLAASAAAGGGGRGAAAGPPDEALMVSIDRAGVDVRVRRGGAMAVERLRFPTPVDTPAQAHEAMRALLAAAPGPAA